MLGIVPIYKSAAAAAAATHRQPKDTPETRAVGACVRGAVRARRRHSHREHAEMGHTQ